MLKYSVTPVQRHTHEVFPITADEVLSSPTCSHLYHLSGALAARAEAAAHLIVLPDTHELRGARQRPRNPCVWHVARTQCLAHGGVLRQRASPRNAQRYRMIAPHLLRGLPSHSAPTICALQDMPTPTAKSRRGKQNYAAGVVQHHHKKKLGQKGPRSSLPAALHVKKVGGGLAACVEGIAWQAVDALWPAADLRTGAETEVSTDDYGGNSIKLNLDHRIPGAGWLIVGAYHNVKPWRQGKLTVDSEPHIRWMRAVCASLLSVPLLKPRLEAVFGACTLPHTDGFRGFQLNWVRWLDKGACLLLRVDWHFRRSLVMIGSRYYIPLRYEAKGEAVLISFSSEQIQAAKQLTSQSITRGQTQACIQPSAFKIKVTLSSLRHMRTVGLLPSLAVLGTDKGAVKVMPVGSSISSSADAPAASFVELLSEALANPPQQGPSVVPVGGTMQWESFDGTRFVHWLHGKPGTRRVHVSSHQITQQMGCSMTKKQSPMFYYKVSSDSWVEQKVKRGDDCLAYPRKRTHVT